MVRPETDLERERAALRLFEEVVELAPDERERRIETSCAGDARLRERVEELLGIDTSGRTPRPPRLASEILPPVAEERLPGGARLGPFEIVRLVAAGGMGEVYEATQDSPRRRVALKVLRRGLASESSERRFRFESELLGRLRHPGIAQVHESGVHVDGGRAIPWFAMEFVPRARDLSTFAREERLDLRARVTLFADVCDAVQHGHLNGVIHRDLKPGNLLVDDAGRPKVIDFGIARSTTGKLDLTALDTLPGALLGTMQYMSPEQLEGDPSDIDTRSDVYGLGVVLYELLTGRLPYGAGAEGLAAWMRAVTEEPAARARSLAREIDADLDAVLLRCLEKERERRYSSAGALGQELRRWLAHEPVEARLPGARRQLVLAARRHRLAFGAAAGALGALVIGAIVSIVFALEAGRQRDRSEASREALLDFSVAVAMDLTERMFEHESITQAQRELVTGTLEHLEHLLDMSGEDPEVLATVADAYIRLGTVQGSPSAFNLGDHTAASASFEEALELVDRIDAAAPGEVANRRRRATIRIQQAALAAAATRDLEGALGILDEALGILDELPGDDVETRTQLANALATVGRTQGASGDHAGARASLTEAVALLRELVAADPRDTKGCHSLSQVLGNLGLAHVHLGQPEPGLELLLEALEIGESLVREDPTNRIFRTSLNARRGTILPALAAVGDFGRMEELADRAYADLMADLQAEPANARHQRNAAIMCLTAGDALLDAQRFEPARLWLSRGAELLVDVDPGAGLLAGVKRQLTDKLLRAERELATAEDG